MSGTSDATPPPGPAPGLTTGAVARRLGVSPTTLRSWDRRYGLGPAAREDGRHRRWTPADIAMLAEMCRLTASGVPPAEAARAARTAAGAVHTGHGRPVPPPARPGDAAPPAPGPAPGDPAASGGPAPDGGTPAPGDAARTSPPGPSGGWATHASGAADGSAADGTTTPGSTPRTDRPEPTGGSAAGAAGPASGTPPAAGTPAPDTAAGPHRTVPQGGPVAGGSGPAAPTASTTPGAGPAAPGTAGGAGLPLPPHTPAPGAPPPAGATPAEEARRQLRGLARAAVRLDGPALDALLGDFVERHGLVAAWEEVMVPALHAVGRRWESSGDRYVEVEHLLSWHVSTALRRALPVGGPGVPAAVPGAPPVLLACVPAEQHTLPLEALAAGLAARGVPVRMLGAAVPPEALDAAVRRTGPAAVVLWSQARSTASHALARHVAGTAFGVRGARTRPLVALAGPGWAGRAPDPGLARPASLHEALALLTALYP